MKQKAYFTFENSENKKEMSWSGSSFSLFKAMCRYFDLIPIYMIKQSFVERLYFFFVRKFFPQKKSLLKKLWEKLILCFCVKNANMVMFCPGHSFPVSNNQILYQDSSVCGHFLFTEMAKRNMWETNIWNHTDSNENLEILLKDEKKNFENARQVFFMGNWITQEAKKYYPDFSYKFHSVGGGINTSILKFISSESREKNKILFVGKEFYRKGGDLVVKAFEHLKKKRSDLELIIVGPSENPLKKTIDGIHFIGRVPFEDVAFYMSKSDVFCMPSRYEAYGLVFIEALIAGIPCVGRNAWEMPYFIEDGITGRLIDSDNIEDLANAIDSVLDDETMSKNIQSKKEYYIQKYNWDSVADSIYNIMTK